MEVKAKKLNGANASAEAKISGEVVKGKEEKILKTLAKDANVAGFRKGKVPTSVLRARYGEKVKTDAEQEAVRELYDLAIKELGFDEKDVVGEPIFSKFERSESGDIDVELKISYKPVIKLEGYEECIPEFKLPRVTKAETDERIKNLLRANAPLKTIEGKRAAKEGDFVVIDFEGFIGDVAFEGGKAENYTLEIGSKSFIEGFEEGLVGVKAGGSKDVAVTFPQSYGNKDLSGKEAVFKVKLHEIKEKDVSEEISEELLKKLLPNEPTPTKELLDEKIKEQIKNEKISKLYHEDLKPKFVEAMVQKFDFDLPDYIVEQEIDVLFRNTFVNIKPEELEEYKKDPKKTQEKRESYRGEAHNSVKLTFIVSELALLNNINVTDQEVTQMIYFEAIQYGQEPKTHFENYKKQGVLPAIKMAMIEDRLFQTLFDKANKGK
ncbi:MAG: trigger factor [Campylobacteraceae bacterium]|jgi:trigger factor|nr:trigger factor [Campylobacteraceae bacterium]